MVETEQYHFRERAKRYIRSQKKFRWKKNKVTAVPLRANCVTSFKTQHVSFSPRFKFKQLQTLGVSAACEHLFDIQLSSYLLQECLSLGHSGEGVAKPHHTRQMECFLSLIHLSHAPIW